jgi:alpha/beta superfamily hydrolase
MEEFVCFNSNGLKLYGILHIPGNDVVNRKAWINILNPGLKNRVAPNRLNIKIARMLCKKGFYVLRFDPKGIGDSEGDISNNNYLRLDLWGEIQKGLFVEDTLESISFLKNTINIEKVVLIGNCGGAITAILSAYRNKHISGLILIDTPVRISTSDISLSDVMIENTSYKEILKNIFKKDSWSKLYKLYGSENVYSFIKHISKNFLKKLIKLSIFKNDIQHVSERFNYEFFRVFNIMAKKMKILFIFAENDSNLKEWNEDMGENIKKLKNNKHLQIRTIKNANHIYSEEESQLELINCIGYWIENYTNN